MNIQNYSEELKKLHDEKNSNKMDEIQDINLLNNTKIIIEHILCNKCKRQVDKFNMKKVFGQNNIYECKGNELKNCTQVLNKENEIKIIKIKEEDEKKQKLFDEEYLDYIIENQDNFIKLSGEYQYRDANVRYYDTKKKIVFKKSIHNNTTWSMDNILNKPEHISTLNKLYC